MSKEKTNEKIEKVESEAPISSGDKETFENAIQDMVDDTPEVQQHVVEKYENDAVEQKAKINTINENAGETFNPEIHAVKKDGSPSLTKKGKFRKKTVKSTQKINNPMEAEATAQAEVVNNEQMIAESKATAIVVQNLKRSAYDNFLDFPIDDARHNTHVDMTTAYLVSEGGVKLSPLQALMIMEAGLGIEAFRTQKGQEKLTGIKAKLASWYIKMKGKKKNGTHSNSRADNIGKNKNSDKTSANEKGKDK